MSHINRVGILAVAVLALLGACKDPGPTPSWEASAPHAAASGTPIPGLDRGHAHAGDVRRPPTPDPRSAAQLAVAGCSGAAGWACPGLKRPLVLAAGSSTGATIQPSWTVPNWYTDPANLTGCASDTNSCTSATCGATGVGPCVNVNEVVYHRWGTPSPILTQNTTITLLSSETVGQENVVLQPVLAQGSWLAVLGTPQLVASLTLGSVTAKNRATATLLQSTGFTSGSQGNLVVNTTSGKASNAIIYSKADTDVTLTQPLAPTTPAVWASIYLGAMPAEVNTWASGDTVSVYSLPLLNLKVFQSLGSDSSPTIQGGVAWLQYVHVPDASGTNDGSFLALGTPAGSTIWVNDSQIDPYAQLFGPNSGGVEGAIAIGDLGSEMIASNASFFGGGIASPGSIVFRDNATLDGDSILPGLSVTSGSTFIGNAYISSSAGIFYSAVAELANIWGNGTQLYGAATCNVQNNATLEKGTSTWAATLTLSGGLQLNAQTTGTSYATGTWTDGRTITAANLDTYAGLLDPHTGAKYCNTF